jgi:hypothetical protein
MRAAICPHGPSGLNLLSGLALSMMFACGDSGSGTTGDTSITSATTPPATTPSTMTDATEGATAGSSPTDGADASMGEASTAGAEESSAGPGTKLDVPSGETDTGGPPAGEGCQKVDFLFVLDNSISMGDEQQNLASSFPGFIETIQTEVQAQDYHIMVIDTDDQDKWGEKWDKCNVKCMTDDPGDSCLTVYFDDIICGMEPPPPPVCDQTLGAGRSQGAGGPPVVCPIADGQRYMTQAQPELPATFECVAKMGATGNSNERPIAAMLEALGPQTQGGGCHPGFLRDDAVLVVTMISDEEENGSPGTPPEWYAELLARKGGNATAITLLALSGDNNIMGQECVETPKMTEFVGMFGARGSIASICEADYGPFFAEAVAIVDYTCDEYVPQ